MSISDLMTVYCAIVRPSVEYSSVVYHSLIPDYLSEALEAVQRRALRIIYGSNADIGGLVSDTVGSLKDRRVSSAMRFAEKSLVSERYGEKWFKRRPQTHMETRPTTRNKYEEPAYRTERDKSNPLAYLTRLLNGKEK